MTCTLCPLHESALTVCVPGKGAEPATIMLVGQAPGAKEDTLGEAFVGKAGHLLDQMLDDAGYDREQVYITNAVKCKPPIEPGTWSERAPNTEEIDACRTHLTREIHRIKPKVIIALGDVALRSLTRLSGIGGKRGKSYPLHKMFAYDCEVWPTFHPAYVLRVPASQPTVTVDLRRIRDQEIEPEKIEWVRLGKHACYTFTSDDAYAALDIETIDENGKIVAHPTQFAVAGAGGYALVGDPKTQLYLWDDSPVVHHNGLEFDLPRLGYAPTGYDTMYLAHLLDENQPLNLEALCVKYLGVRGWKEDRDAPLGTDRLAEYNARDAVFTLRLFHVFRSALGPRIKIYERIMLPTRIALNACTARGLYVDGNAVAVTRAQVEHEIARDRARVLAIAAEWGDAEGFNPNSVPQLARAFTRMGVELPRTDKGAHRVDKSVLQAIPGQVPNAGSLANAVLDLRAGTKRLSTYVVPYEKAAREADHRMHNEYGLIRTKVGRTNARKTNVQNLDRELDFFSAPPGSVLVKADYAAMHFRLAAWCAGAKSILDRYAADPLWDPHLFFGQRFYVAETLTKMQRQIAKSANFSQLYMGDEHTLQNYAAKMGITLSLEVCAALHQYWHRTFPEFVPWYQSVWNEVVANGYCETAVGRRRNFGDVRLLNRLGRAAAHREAVNMKVLGLEPDISLLGLSECHRAGLPVNGFFHDCVSFEFDNIQGFYDNKDEITRLMTDVPVQILRDEFDADITVPLVVEFTVYESREK